MRKLLFVWIACLGLSSPLWAQKPATKKPAQLAKEAAEYEKNGDYEKAAAYYESAFAQKGDNLEWIYLAGKCYLYVRDYANAAKCLEKVKDQDANPKFDKPGYKYALALKQTGQYDRAGDAFGEFMAQYKGADADALRKTVENEIKGCQFALKAQEYTDPNISLQHLPATINTDKIEFAPIPFNDDVLYFSSTSSGAAAIYRTQKVNGNWVRPQTPTLFAGKMEKPNFGNGSFTPDGKRFYFTQCDVAAGGKPRCAIYLMLEDGGEWQSPVKLPDYINTEGANTTQPFVTLEADKEVLYFVSDREGGKGGLDIWYCTRTASSKGYNFTLPKNLGSNINTPGDEISPFYHDKAQTLFFSSNGWVGAGGLDVFKSKGSQLKWEVAQNVGFPINSAADDLYYVVSEAHKGGYVVSNRAFDPNKVATTNDDVFYFGEKRIEVTIQGKIYDTKDDQKNPLSDVNIKFFEVVDGSEELLENRMLAVAEYKYVLKANKTYLIEISKEGYSDFSFEVKTNGFRHSETQTKDIALEIPTYNEKDVLATIVPPAHNTRNNAYKLPSEPPLDPKTKKPFAEGTPTYVMFKKVEDIANLSPDHKVYYDGAGGEIIPFMGDLANNTKSTPKPDNTDKGTPQKLDNIFPADAYTVEEGVQYKIQVAAVRKYRENYYAQLQKLNGMKLDFEVIEGGLTRVLLIPDQEGVTGFESKGKVLESLKFVLDNTRFKTAFAARYRENTREGEGFRGLDETETSPK